VRSAILATAGFLVFVEKKNYSLKDSVQQMKKFMAGVGCLGLFEAENDGLGGLQSLFDVEQAKNIANYVHRGSALFIIWVYPVSDLKVLDKGCA